MNNIISINELWEIYHLPSHIICIVDRNGCIRHANPSFARILGYSEEMLVGKKFSSYVHPDDVKTNLTISNNTAYDAPVYFSNRMRTSNGGYIKFSWMISAPVTGSYVYAQAQVKPGDVES